MGLKIKFQIQHVDASVIILILIFVFISTIFPIFFVFISPSFFTCTNTWTSIVHMPFFYFIKTG